MIFLLTTVEMLNVLFAYLVVFGAKLRKEKRYIIVISYVLGLAIQTGSYLMVGDLNATLITTCYWFVLPICWFERRKRKWFALYPFIFVGMGVINAAISYVVAVFLGIPGGQIVEIGWLQFLCECGGMLLLVVMKIYQKKRMYDAVEVELNPVQYLFLFIGIICSGILIGCVQVLSQGWEMTVRVENIIGLILVIMCVIFIVVCLWQGIIMHQRMVYKNQTQQYEKYMQMQEEQIHQIMEKDEMMRKFRHDLNVHMTALQACAEAQNYEQLREYLSDMKHNSYIKREVSYTGDSVIDAVLREYLGQAEEAGIEVYHTIHYDRNNQVKIYDICTIISNLLKNAIEACGKLETGKRKIDYKMGSMDNFLQIIVENTANGKVDINDYRLSTSKKDKKNHGLGSEIVRQTAQKYGGSVDYHSEETSFRAEVLLKVNGN